MLCCCSIGLLVGLCFLAIWYCDDGKGRCTCAFIGGLESSNQKKLLCSRARGWGSADDKKLRPTFFSAFHFLTQGQIQRTFLSSRGGEVFRRMPPAGGPIALKFAKSAPDRRNTSGAAGAPRRSCKHPCVRLFTPKQKPSHDERTHVSAFLVRMSLPE